MSEPKSYVAKRGYAGIRRRLLFLLLLLAMTPLLALGLFCYDRLGALYDEKLAIGLESVTNSKHRALDTFLTERVSQIRTLAFTHSYEELSDPERLSSIFSVMQAHSRSFADVGIIGMGFFNFVKQYNRIRFFPYDFRHMPASERPPAYLFLLPPNLTWKHRLSQIYCIR